MSKRDWNDYSKELGRRELQLKRLAKSLTVVLLVVLVIFTLAAIWRTKQDSTVLSEKNQEHWEERIEEQNAQRERLKNYTVYDKLKREEDLRVFVMGDEIAAQRGKEYSNSGWYDLLESAWKREYKIQVTKIDNTAYGTNVLQWLYEYQQMDKSAKKYDIAFLSLGYNDQQEMKAEQFGQCYEALIRQMKKDNPKCEIVLMIANCMKETEFIDKIKELCDYYDLVCLDMVKGFQKAALSESELTSDGFYPNNDGYREYYDNISTLIKKNLEDKKEISGVLPDWLDEEGSQFNHLVLVPIAEMEKESDTTYKYETASRMVGVSYMTESDYGGTFTTYLNNEKVQDYETDSFESSDQAGLIGSSLKGSNRVKLKIAERDTGFVTLYGLIVNE